METHLTGHVSRVLRIEPSQLERTTPLGSLGFDSLLALELRNRLEEVFAISDRVTIFRNGRSSAPERTADLTTPEIVRRMLGRELGDMFPGHARADEQTPVRLAVTGLTTAGVDAPVDLTVRRGQILGLTGQLGAGGSALLRALAGQDLVQGRPQ